jgi:hypothetical protein
VSMYRSGSSDPPRLTYNFTVCGSSGDHIAPT